MNNWINVSDRLPELGSKVLAFYKNELNKNRTITAIYFEKFTEESEEEDDDDVPVEYCEANDTYYYKEGWYECIDNWDDFAFVKVYDSHIITHWMPLPSPPEEKIKWQ